MKDQPFVNAELGIYPMGDGAHGPHADLHDREQLSLLPCDLAHSAKLRRSSEDLLIDAGDREQLPLLPTDDSAEKMWVASDPEKVRVFISRHYDDHVTSLRNVMGRDAQRERQARRGDRSHSPEDDRTGKTTPQIEKPPAHALVSVGSWLLSESSYKRYVEPHVADIYHEYFRAISLGNDREARKVVLWGYIRALWPLLAAALRTVRTLLRISGA